MGTLTNMYRNNSLTWTFRNKTFHAPREAMPKSIDDRRALFYFWPEPQSPGS